jgi:hypothetical protein
VALPERLLVRCRAVDHLGGIWVGMTGRADKSAHGGSPGTIQVYSISIFCQAVVATAACRYDLLSREPFLADLPVIGVNPQSLRRGV